MEALFLSHFFPAGRPFYWIYVFWLYWSTMVSLAGPSVASRALTMRSMLQYLTHHYLVDLVAGGSLAVICFYYFLPEGLRHLPPSASDLAATSSHHLNGYVPTAGEEEKGFELEGEGWEEEEEEAEQSRSTAYPPTAAIVPLAAPLSIKVNGGRPY